MSNLWPEKWSRLRKKLEQWSLKRVFEKIFDRETKRLFTKCSLAYGR